MAINKIVKNSITGDAIDATKIADDAVSEEHLDNTAITGNRSEERRVGKECRSRWSPRQEREEEGKSGKERVYR